MVKAHQCQEGGMKIVVVHSAFNSLDTIFIRDAITKAFFNTRTHHEHWVASNVMVTAILALFGGKPAEFTSEQN